MHLRMDSSELKPAELWEHQPTLAHTCKLGPCRSQPPLLLYSAGWRRDRPSWGGSGLGGGQVNSLGFHGGQVRLQLLLPEGWTCSSSHPSSFFHILSSLKKGEKGRPHLHTLSPCSEQYLLVQLIHSSTCGERGWAAHIQARQQGAKGQ